MSNPKLKIIPFIALAISLLLTFLVWHNENTHLNEHLRMKFINETKDATSLIKNHIDNYIDVLYGCQGFFNASILVERNEWQAYINGMKIHERYPGIYSLSYVERVKAKDKETFIESVRSNTSIDPSGYPDFKIYPYMEKDEYYVFKYGEPHEKFKTIYGFDLGAESIRLRALEQARDTGKPTATPLIEFITGLSGFSIYLPICRKEMPLSSIDERRQALEGFVLASFTCKELFEEILKLKIISPDLCFEIYDDKTINKNALMYDSDSKILDVGIKSKSRFTRNVTLEIAGRTWLLHFCESPKNVLKGIEEESHFRSQNYVLIGGIIISILLFVSMYLLVTSRARAVLLAEKLTNGLHESNDKLRKMMDELQKKEQRLLNVSRELALINNDLKESNKRLKELDQLKSDFVSTVSHELRTPLAIIKEGISIVSDGIAGNMNEKQKDLLSVAKSNIERLEKIINNLLDISKIEAGKIQITKTFVNISALVNDISGRWRLEFDKKQQDMRIITPKEPINISIDQDKITQALNNLISNAIKFTPAQGRITVELKDNNNEVEISVSDTGMGIAKEDLPKVFTRFQQFHRKAGPGIRGTGLGLAITKELIEMHKGRMWVESEINKGARFVFVLPKT